MPSAHFAGQVLHTHPLLAPFSPSGHSMFPDPLNKPPLVSWLPGSSLSGLSHRGGPLLHHRLSVLRGSSPDLPHPGPAFRSPGFSRAQTATVPLLSVTPPAGLSCLLCCVLPSQCPIRFSTQFSRLCLKHPVTQCLSTCPSLQSSCRLKCPQCNLSCSIQIISRSCDTFVGNPSRLCAFFPSPQYCYL